MFNKSFLIALILCVCYFAATSARPGLVPDLPLSAVSGLAGGGKPLELIQGAVSNAALGAVTGGANGALGAVGGGALPGPLGK